MTTRWAVAGTLLMLLARGVGAAEPLNLNTATQAELTAIGFSESQALQVIGHREKNGPFLQVDELHAVPQVIKDTVTKVRRRVTVDE